MFIIKFSDNECWIAPWEGDPGRTLARNSAREFRTFKIARKFADKCIKENIFRNFELTVESKEQQ